MSTLFNPVTSHYADTMARGVFISGIAVLAVVLLLCFLIAKVFLDAYETTTEYNIHTFTIVVITLLFVLVKVGFVRVAQILHLM